MKKLDINITKASIMSFEVSVKEGRPEVGVSLALMTEGGKIITTYNTGTESWRSDRIDLPVNALPMIGEIARLLEGLAVRKCRDSQQALPAPRSTRKPEKSQPAPAIVNKTELPIDLSEIPF